MGVSGIKLSLYPTVTVEYSKRPLIKYKRTQK